MRTLAIGLILATGLTAQMAAAQDSAPFAVEDQTPTGRMTTAAEVKPILAAIRSDWIAVRLYDGQDLLYFTNLLSWRCGLHEIRYAVNGAADQVLATEPCHLDTDMPNGLSAETVMPFVIFPAGSIQTVQLRLLYDDMTVETASFQRNEVEIP